MVWFGLYSFDTDRYGEVRQVAVWSGVILKMKTKINVKIYDEATTIINECEGLTDEDINEIQLRASNNLKECVKK